MLSEGLGEVEGGIKQGKSLEVSGSWLVGWCLSKCQTGR